MPVNDPDFPEFGFFVKIRVLVTPGLDLDVTDNLYFSLQPLSCDSLAFGKIRRCCGEGQMPSAELCKLLKHQASLLGVG